MPDKFDDCPNQPEDMDGFKDDDGCPDLDNDNDGIPDNNETVTIDITVQNNLAVPLTNAKVTIFPALAVPAAPSSPGAVQVRRISPGTAPGFASRSEPVTDTTFVTGSGRSGTTAIVTQAAVPGASAPI